MGKLTIEEKAQAYDEALGRATSSLKDDTITNTAKSYIEEIFPELKEDREEKIRKLLIRLFTSNANEKFDDVSTQEIIAWLEKQAPIDEERIVKGVRRGVAMSLMEYIDTNTKGMCLSNMECEDIENAVINEDWGKVYRYMKKKVEKQDVPNSYNGVSFKYNGYTWGMCPRDNGVEILIDGEIKEKVYLYDRPQGESVIKSKEEPQVGENITYSETDGYKVIKPKLKPKFHEGQWITNGDYTWKIIEVRPLDYILKSQDGNIVDDNISYVDEEFHLWTIKDAKDGDILVTNKKQPFIFNGHYDEDTDYIYGYCGISDLVKDDSFYANEENVEEECNVWCVNENIYLATKEQCDLLFSKMKDAGYEWDAEKKEPKKIEEPENFKKQVMSEITDLVTEYIKQKSAWSEEDETNFRGIMDEIEANKNSGPDYDVPVYNKYLCWLESIKQRIVG